MSARDMEIELMAGMQEMVAQQNVMVRLLSKMCDTHQRYVNLRLQELEAEKDRGRSRSPAVRPSPTRSGNIEEAETVPFEPTLIRE